MNTERGNEQDHSRVVSCVIASIHALYWFYLGYVWMARKECWGFFFCWLWTPVVIRKTQNSRPQIFLGRKFQVLRSYSLINLFFVLFHSITRIGLGSLKQKEDKSPCLS